MQVYTKRRLPHWYVPGAAHFVTFRLHGSLPAETLEILREKKELLLRQKPPAGQSRGEHRQRLHKQLFAEYDRQLDAHQGVALMSDPRIAAMVRQSIYYLHNRKYGLLAYTIMPNHIHLLIVPHEQSLDTAEPSEIGEAAEKQNGLSKALHSLKGFTAHEANRILQREGPFWQHESYDHWVRDDEELERIVAYIDDNAVKAGLSQRAHEYCWCSAHDRYLMDGDTCGWLALDSVGQASCLPGLNIKLGK